jgi:aspartate carbamoyltransferase catalytic subunit
MRHLLDTRSLSLAQLQDLLETARVIETGWPSARLQDSLRDRLLINMFYEASTRTRISFEVAAKRLGMQVVNFAVTGSAAEKGETLVDTFLTLQAMAPDILVGRHSDNGAITDLAQYADEGVHIVCAGEGTRSHPSQALIDAYTIQKIKGSVKGLKIVIAGDILHSRVAVSNIELLAKLGAAEIRLCGPTAWLPRGSLPGLAGIYETLEEAVLGADVIMMLRIQHERIRQTSELDLPEYARNWCFNSRVANLASDNHVVMHPGPINRGVEITDEMADGPRSAIHQQIANGVFVRMAIISTLLNQ